MIRAALSLAAQVALLLLTLWTLGACLGVVTIGYCMVAGGC